eukprot:gnl/TRDRNA2_/TRDRNA2_175585_c9_seq1.p1 gnl/TRDRNA2_/TRDRNA2_175585_c9~~gnl/TRDRNA2_/TRDRNA2_175585_c9_seq1.p1  ORF type:complete len:111 (+),score=9.74 gnl/TRDRNA2_/TRDRNA2_175585_c9_seq1:759-1091(+)
MISAVGELLHSASCLLISSWPLAPLPYRLLLACALSSASCGLVAVAQRSKAGMCTLLGVLWPCSIGAVEEHQKAAPADRGVAGGVCQEDFLGGTEAVDKNEDKPGTRVMI